jgi:flavin-binding protein dodecin
MTVVKVAEIVGSSPSSWQEAAQEAVSAAQRSYKNITGVELLNMTAEVENGNIVEYKADVQVAYVE